MKKERTSLRMNEEDKRRNVFGKQLQKINVKIDLNLEFTIGKQLQQYINGLTSS